MSMITDILVNMIPMRDIKQISEGDRLFYELGEEMYGNWVRSGKFKEIDDVKDFLEHDKLLSNLEYLNHHNFMLIKNSQVAE